MDAKAKPIEEILHSGHQFLVPFFQRNYSWKRDNWERLSDDILSLIDERDRKKHFLGPLVCAGMPPMPGEVIKFQLIDGQQRLTTLSLLLLAIKKVAKEKGEDELAAEIHETLLVHPHKKGMQRYKLVPRTGDREVYQAMLDDKSYDAFTPRLLTEGYDYFRKLVQTYCIDDAQKLKVLFDTVINRIYLVVITLDKEDPYEIFDSLNSTGLPLEESDLIRNFVFMQVPLDLQEEFQSECWQDFENSFDKDGLAINPTRFYREFLMRDGKYVKKDSVFSEFRSYFEQSVLTPEKCVQQLHHYLKIARIIASDGVGLQAKAQQSLQQLNSMDVESTVNPLLMNLLNLYTQKSLAENDLIKCLSAITSFVFRRTICNESTRAYGKWFCECIAELGDDPCGKLSAYLLHRGWPDDEAFVRSAIEFQLYRREHRKCRTALHAIELGHGHKEAPNLAPMQIEHVMPQSLPKGEAGKEWRSHLGESADRQHKAWLDTLGNLTLTGYNGNLSNKSFSEKKKIFAASKLCMNESIASSDSWTVEKIRARGKQLAEKLASIWTRPESSVPFVPTRNESETQLKAGRERRSKYWTDFEKCLQRMNCPFSLSRPAEGLIADIFVPFSDMGLTCRYALAKNELEIELYFLRKRGKAIFDRLLEDRVAIESHCGGTLEWNDGAKQSITTRKSNVSIKDPIDWLEQHEWMAKTLAHFHGAFFNRLEMLSKSIKEKSEHKQQLMEYWTGFHCHLFETKSLIAGTTPLPQNWNNFPIGRSWCFLEASVSQAQNQLRVALFFGGDTAKSFFEQMSEYKHEVEREFGVTLDWFSADSHKQSRISLSKIGKKLATPDQWGEDFIWFRQTLEKFDSVFRRRILELK